MTRNRSFPRARHASQIVRAAQYARKSTDAQKYSIDNQKDIMAAYAACNRMEIVRSYIDYGKSGLTIEGRPALKRLIHDVSSGQIDFEVILVSDVSRWGRFQDTDESAHYEFVCKRAGVKIQYCAEQFSNDGTILSALLKSIKRAMAAEYSRDLSAKIFHSQIRLSRLGHRQGAVAGYGFRRLLLDVNGTPRMLLKENETKVVNTDSVILVPGPKEELQAIKTIYKLYVNRNYDRVRIARYLNQRGLLNASGKEWRGDNVLEILTNEKYIGNLIYNRTSIKLKSRRIYNHPNQWVRVEGVFEPLIDRQMFERAQHRAKFSSRRTTNELLDYLTCTLCVKGFLTPDVIDSVSDGPCSTTFCERFGTLAEAYRQIGYRLQHWRHRKLIGDPAFNKTLVPIVKSVAQ
jgi:DNA invertase Pin-like site-specific DNA recombinase